MRYFSHLFFITILYLCCSTITNAKTIYVDKNGGGDFLTIQDGIDAASDGDTVVVGEGVYTRSFNLTKDLTLTSNSPEHTVIEDSGICHLGYVGQNMIKISNFSFINCSIRDSFDSDIPYDRK